MSLSPTEDSSADELLQYDSGWAATNRLLRAGHSFSGRERNCCFLNLGAAGSGRFANVSAATGLDLIDDGRGLALCDWDHDGRLDFWITNRTGPRVRFLRNQLETSNRFVALRLQGASANRDAIGARVEVYLKEPATTPDLVKTLYGGSGYLSQSSKWLHFGLGQAATIGKVVVRWPGGEAEAFSGVTADRYQLLQQGSGTARVESLPPQPPFGPAGPPVTEPVQGGAARVVLLKPAPMPALDYQDASGAPAALDALRGRPLLLNLWATWCGNCLAEMAEWGAAEDRFHQAGVQVLSLCTDEPGDDPSKAQKLALDKARAAGFPLPVGFAQHGAVELLNVLQKAFIGRQADLPLPSSFLIDADGRLAVIYKGPVSPAQVVADAAVLGAGADAIVAAAVPFPGNWLEAPRGSEPRSVAVSLVENGLKDAAADYLLRLIPLYEKPLPGADEEAEEKRVSELVECHTFLGAIRFDEGQFAPAAEGYERALALAPGKRSARKELVRTLLELGRKADAVPHLQALLEDRREAETLVSLARLHKELAQPDEAIARFGEALALKPVPEVRLELANLLRDQGRKAEAVANYRGVLALQPDAPLPANNLAWILATDPDPAIRNGADAVKFAKLACAATEDRVPHFHGTLAAAYAEIGDFPAALLSIGRAIELAKEYQDADLVLKLEEKQQLYQSGKPFRDS